MVLVSYEIALIALSFILSVTVTILAFKSSFSALGRKISEVDARNEELRSNIEMAVRLRSRDNRELLERLEMLTSRLENLEIRDDSLRAVSREKLLVRNSR